MSEFSPLWAETRDVELAKTKRKAVWGSGAGETAGVMCPSAEPQLPAVRAVSEGAGGVPKTNFFPLGRCPGIKPTNCKLFPGVPTKKGGFKVW